MNTAKSVFSPTNTLKNPNVNSATPDIVHSLCTKKQIPNLIYTIITKFKICQVLSFSHKT